MPALTALGAARTNDFCYGARAGVWQRSPGDAPRCLTTQALVGKRRAGVAPMSAHVSPQQGSSATPTSSGSLEIGFDIVLGAAIPHLKVRHEGVLRDLHQPRRAAAFLHDQRTAAAHQRFLGNAEQIAAALLDIGAGFVDISQPTSISEVRLSGNTDVFLSLAITIPPLMCRHLVATRLILGQTKKPM